MLCDYNSLTFASYFNFGFRIQKLPNQKRKRKKASSLFPRMSAHSATSSPSPSGQSSSTPAAGYFVDQRKGMKQIT
jgi:hypothetical protein